MTTCTATYDPDDNKLRLRASARLDKETFDRIKAKGFKWAPKQELFVAPKWTPGREDLLVELAGQIDDEDTSLADRAAQRAERFEDYSEARTRDADKAHDTMRSIMGAFTKPPQTNRHQYFAVYLSDNKSHPIPEAKP